MKRTPPHNARQRYQLERLKIGYYIVFGAWVVTLAATSRLFGVTSLIAYVGFAVFAALAVVIEAAWEMRIVHGPGWWRGVRAHE